MENFENEYLKVLEFTGETNRSGRKLFRVLCKKCGNKVIMHSNQLKKNKSCGCGLINDLTGFKNNYLKILSRDTERSTKDKKYWKAECKKCGYIFSIRSDAVKSFKSCNKCEMLGFENDNIKVLEILKTGEGTGVLYRGKCKKCGNENVEILGARIKHFTHCGCERINNIYSEYGHIEKGSIKEELFNTYKKIQYKYRDHNIKFSDRWENNFDNFYNDVIESYSEILSREEKQNIHFTLIDTNKKCSNNNYIWSNKMQIIKKNKSKMQSYFIGEKDDRKIVAFSKASFSRIVLNHYNKDNSIRSVIVGVCKSWHGWSFKEITKNEFDYHIKNDGEYIKDDFDYNLKEYYKFNPHLFYNKPLEEDRHSKTFMAYDSNNDKYYVNNNRKNFCETFSLDYECVVGCLGGRSHIHNNFTFSFISKDMYFDFLNNNNTQDILDIKKELKNEFLKYEKFITDDAIPTNELIGKKFTSENSGDFEVISFEGSDKNNSRIFKIKFIATGNEKEYAYSTMMSKKVHDSEYLLYLKKEEFIGRKFKNNQGDEYEVLDIYYNGIYNFVVEFDEHFGIKFKTEISQPILNEGCFKNPYYPGSLGGSCCGIPNYKYEELKAQKSRWSSMINRIYNKDSINYDTYGGKGVSICDRWHCFEYYLEDIQKLEGFDKDKLGGLMLDKDILSNELNIDPAVYSPETCKWITPKESVQDILERNYDRFKCINLKTGESFIALNQMETAEKLGIDYRNLNAILKNKRNIARGWHFTYDLEAELKDLAFIKQKEIINE